LVQAFVSCRLDHCNSLFFGISEGLMNQFQNVWLLIYSTFAPHNAGAPSSTLVTGMPARPLQDCDACSLVAVWHCASTTTIILSLMLESDNEMRFDCKVTTDSTDHN